MANVRIDWRRTVTYAGAFIAFLIGSGFATGQEVVQYFSGYAWFGLVGILVVFLLFLYVGRIFVTLGHQRQMTNGGDIYRYLCGPIVGRFFDYFSVLFIYMSFVVMMSGTGATVAQQYGMAPWLGAVVMGTVVAVTVVYGLANIVTVLGRLGPVIVVLTIGLGLMGIVNHPAGLVKAAEVVPRLNLLTASSHWFFAAVSYVGFCMLWLAGFMSLMGRSATSLKEVKLGAALGALGFSFALLVIALGLMANIELIAGSQVPNLALAADIYPVFASMFAIIVLAGIYTTAVPLLWQAAARFTDGASWQFKLTTVVLAALGVFVGLKVPFDRLVNLIYVINGYVGIMLLLFMLYHTFKHRRA